MSYEYVILVQYRLPTVKITVQVYVGRISTGIGTGLCSIPATVYTAEVADSSIRGLLVTGTSVSIALGVVIVYILGALLKVHHFTMLSKFIIYYKFKLSVV